MFTLLIFVALSSSRSHAVLSESFDFWILKERSSKGSFDRISSPTFASKRIPIKELGRFAECLLADSLIKKGFTEFNNSSLEDPAQVHAKGQKLAGEAYYNKYPWEVLFPQFKFSQAVTWEQVQNRFSPKRVYLPLMDFLSFARAIDNHPCSQTSWAKSFFQKIESGNVTVVRSESLFCSWNSQVYFCGKLRNPSAKSNKTIANFLFQLSSFKSEGQQ